MGKRVIIATGAAIGTLAIGVLREVLAGVVADTLDKIEGLLPPWVSVEGSYFPFYVSATIAVVMLTQVMLITWLVLRMRRLVRHADRQGNHIKAGIKIRRITSNTLEAMACTSSGEPKLQRTERDLSIRKVMQALKDAVDKSYGVDASAYLILDEDQGTMKDMRCKVGPINLHPRAHTAIDINQHTPYRAIRNGQPVYVNTDIEKSIAVDEYADGRKHSSARPAEEFVMPIFKDDRRERSYGYLHVEFPKSLCVAGSFKLTAELAAEAIAMIIGMRGGGGNMNC